MRRGLCAGLLRRGCSSTSGVSGAKGKAIFMLCATGGMTSDGSSRGKEVLIGRVERLGLLVFS